MRAIKSVCQQVKEVKAIVLLTCLFSLMSSVNAAEEVKENIRQQGQWYGYWGWNRSQYSDSNISFKGEDHDFTLHKTSAKDRQNKVTVGSIFNRYLNPAAITIPQYNYRVGYFVADNWAISLGFDHMKYVVEQGQIVGMTGTISSPGFEKTDPAREDKQISGDFMNFEHTDGLNMISVETEYFHSLWSHGKDFDFALMAGAGIGFMYPKTNVKMLGYERNDEFHVAGYATSVKGGFEFTFYHNWFFRGVAKFGYTDMDDILTTKQGGKASQTFYFDEYIGAIGYRF
jgi:hypothetical protein